MKKQFLQILGIFILMLVVGNVMGQGVPQPKAENSDNGSPTECGASIIDIYIEQSFDPKGGALVIPNRVVITKEYITWDAYEANSSVEAISEEVTIEPFAFDVIDYNQGVALMLFEENASYCPEEAILISYYYYKVTVESFFNGISYTSSAILIEDGDARIMNYVTDVVVAPNPITTQANVNFSVIASIDQLSITVIDETGRTMYSNEYSNVNRGDHKELN